MIIKIISSRLLSGGPTGARTRDTLIKSQVLYQLSYWPEQKRLYPITVFLSRKKLERGLIIRRNKLFWFRRWSRSGIANPVLGKISKQCIFTDEVHR